MDGAVGPLVEAVRRLPIGRPRIPYVSNVTGEWITEAELDDPTYWGRHLRETVRFSAGLETLLANSAGVLLEVGPGGALGALARQNPVCGRDRVVVPSLPHAKDETPDEVFLADALARLWVGGADVDWERYHAGARRNRTVLPTYPFARERYWIERRVGAAPTDGESVRNADVADWFYVPSWCPSPLVRESVDAAERRWLVLEGAGELCGSVADGLAASTAESGEVVRVELGDGFARLEPSRYTVDPTNADDWSTLLGELADAERLPTHVVHTWNLSDARTPRRNVPDGLDSVVSLVQALAARDVSAQLTVVTDSACEVTGAEDLRPEAAGILGLARVVPQEHDRIACRVVDLAGSSSRERVARQLTAELLSEAGEPTVALRNGRRWVQTFEALAAGQGSAPEVDASLVRDGGVYLITGGLGRVGLQMARALAGKARVKLALTGRSAFPAAGEWDGILARGNDERTKATIRALRELETLGAEIATPRGDVTDAEAMRAVIAEVDECFGGLHGIVHAAGVVTGSSMDSIAVLDAEACAAQLAPKLVGIRVLDELLAGRNLDFRMATSSLATVLGGIGMGAYAAANACMGRVRGGEPARRHAVALCRLGRMADRAGARGGRRPDLRPRRSDDAFRGERRRFPAPAQRPRAPPGDCVDRRPVCSPGAVGQPAGRGRGRLGGRESGAARATRTRERLRRPAQRH